MTKPHPQPPTHYELLPASRYYRHPSPGMCVLVNGHVEFHGPGKDARLFLKHCKERQALRSGAVKEKPS